MQSGNHGGSAIHSSLPHTGHTRLSGVDGGDPPPSRVVACVATDGDLLLACLRPEGKRHGGLWEFPGGKTEAGESDRDAAARELREELGVELSHVAAAEFEFVDAEIGCTIAFLPVRLGSEPRCIEHSRLTWARPKDLLALPFAPADRAFLEYLLAAGWRRHG